MQGVCYHLYSRARSAGLADFQVPELQRSPLDELCLQARRRPPPGPRPCAERDRGGRGSSRLASGASGSQRRLARFTCRAGFIASPEGRCRPINLPDMAQGAA
jgi:hypothetical protein